MENEKKTAHEYFSTLQTCEFNTEVSIEDAISAPLSFLSLPFFVNSRIIILTDVAHSTDGQHVFIGLVGVDVMQ